MFKTAASALCLALALALAHVGEAVKITVSTVVIFDQGIVQLIAILGQSGISARKYQDAS